MNTKDNLRSQNTRSRIKDAYLEIIDSGTRPEDVTVTSLCQRAGIHRSSFYLHYSVPTDILAEIEKELIANMAWYFMNLRPETPADSLEPMLCFIRDNDRSFRMILLTTKGEELIQLIISQRVGGLRESEVSPDVKKQLPYLHAYIVGGSKDILRKWMQSGYTESPSFIAGLLTELNKSAIFSLIH